MASGDIPEAPDASPPSSPRDLKLVSNPGSESAPTPPLPSGSPSASPSESPSETSANSTSENPAAAPPAHQRGTDGDGASRQGLPIWLFVVFFLVFALALGWQFRLAGQLEQEIAGLESELAETTALLGAHQTRLIEIRGGVRDVAVQLEGLEALVNAEPADALSSAQPSRESSSAASSRAGAREIPARLPLASE
jgi:hypothetical protein